MDAGLEFELCLEVLRLPVEALLFVVEGLCPKLVLLELLLVCRGVCRGVLLGGGAPVVHLVVVVLFLLVDLFLLRVGIDPLETDLVHLLLVVVLLELGLLDGCMSGAEMLELLQLVVVAGVVGR